MTTHIAFDLDGTVTSQELLPLIATELGLQHEMRLLTELTLAGTIGFEESFRLRCAILKSIPISVVQEIVAEVPMDRDIESFIHQNRNRCSIITGNLDVWIKPLIDRLGCSTFSSVAIRDGDQVLGLKSILHKSEPIQKLKTLTSRIVAVGDSVNDIPMFEAADVGIAFGGVHTPTIRLVEISDYIVFEGGTLCRLLNTL